MSDQEFLENTQQSFSGSSQQSVSTGTNKRKRNRTPISHKWLDEEIQKLIESVEERPPLWNPLEKQYKNRPVKDALWRETSEIVFNNEIDESEAITKWNNLRVQFKSYDTKYKSTKSGQAYIPKTKWQFYDQMNFININNASAMVSESNLPVKNFI